MEYQHKVRIEFILYPQVRGSKLWTGMGLSMFYWNWPHYPPILPHKGEMICVQHPVCGLVMTNAMQVENIDLGSLVCTRNSSCDLHHRTNDVRRCSKQDVGQNLFQHCVNIMMLVQHGNNTWYNIETMKTFDVPLNHANSKQWQDASFCSKYFHHRYN